MTLYYREDVNGGLLMPAGGGAGPSVDPLLAEAVWLLRAETGTGENEGTAGSVLDATGTFAALDSDSWTGSALIGLMTRDTPYNTSETWFTDLDVSATFSIPVHNDNNPSGQWAEILHIPKTGGGGATEWFEFAVVFRDNGDLWIGFDFESGSQTSVGAPTWVSGEVYNGGAPQPLGVIGDWHDGVVEATWRLTIVAATGAVTLYKDGAVVVTDTMGACSFPEPPDGEAVQVGPFQYVLPTKSVSLKASIGGAEIIGWDADDTSGWTLGDGGSYCGPALPDPWFFAGDGEPVTIPNDAALDIAAADDATYAFWFTTQYVADVDGEAFVYALRVAGTLGVNGDGIELRDMKIAAFGADFAGALMGDGSDQAFCMGSHWAAGAHHAVLTIDRDADDAILYIDGASHATADITAVGAIDPDVDLTLTAAAHHAAAKWDRVLTADEIAALPYLLA